MPDDINYENIDLFELFRTKARSLCDVFYDSDIYAPKESGGFYDTLVDEVFGDPLHTAN